LRFERLAHLIPRLSGGLWTRIPLRSAFARNVFRLFAANATAQLLIFAAYPVLTRLYSPEQLGILSSVLFAMMILNPASTLRYEIAVPLARTDAEAGSLLALSFAVIAATCTFTAAVLALLPPAVLDRIGPAAPYRMFLPLSLLAFGVYGVLTYEATRVGRYDEIARTRISQALVGPVIQILLGAAGGGTLGLLTGFAIGLSSGSIGLSRRLIFKTSLLAAVSVRSVIEAAKKHRRFALFSSWAGILLVGSSSLGNVVFTALYGAAVGGYLFLGDRVLMQPLRVSGNAFLQVFVGEAAGILARNPADLLRLFVGVLWKQAAVSAVWLGAVYLSARLVLPVVFGHSWGPAARYIDVMVFGYLPSAAAIPTYHTLLVMGRQRLSAALDALRFAALVACLVIARRAGVSSIDAVFYYSVTQGLAQCVILAVMYRYVRRAASVKAAAL
jgi:O-antigen/teichoic acid export membrane protein